MKTFRAISMGLLSLILSACGSAPHASRVPDGKADVDKLVGAFLPFAERMLRETKEFYPFGGTLGLDGAITAHGASSGKGKSESHDLYDTLHDGFQQEAYAGKIRACIIVFDVRITPPGRTEKQDAIAAEVEHKSGYSVIVYFPYSFDAGGQLKIEQSFATKGDRRIFPK